MAHERPEMDKAVEDDQSENRQSHQHERTLPRQAKCLTIWLLEQDRLEKERSRQEDESEKGE